MCWLCHRLRFTATLLLFQVATKLSCKWVYSCPLFLSSKVTADSVSTDSLSLYHHGDAAQRRECLECNIIINSIQNNASKRSFISRNESIHFSGTRLGCNDFYVPDVVKVNLTVPGSVTDDMCSDNFLQSQLLVSLSFIYWTWICREFLWLTPGEETSPNSKLPHSSSYVVIGIGIIIVVVTSSNSTGFLKIVATDDSL